MKKLFLLGALVSIVASSTMVFATDYNQMNKSGTTEITYGINEGYYLEIPANLDLTTTASEKKLAVTEVRLAAGKKLTVEMESENFGKVEANRYQVVYDNTSCITYTVKKGAAGAVNTEVTENNHELINIDAGETDAEIYLTFTTTDEEIEEATKAGTHTDTLTFTVSVEQRR